MYLTKTSHECLDNDSISKAMSWQSATKKRDLQLQIPFRISRSMLLYSITAVS